MSEQPLIHIIAGPTASGKSGLGLELAGRYNGTIINADSQQIYKALPILTAQPTRDEMEAIPHRLYNYLPPDRACSAAMWSSFAVTEIEHVLKAGGTPILVGGTGFYIKALVDGMSPIPPVSAETREFAKRMQAMIGQDAFYALLEASDPKMAARLHPNDTQRVMRAWEVMQSSGKSLAHWQSLPPEPPRPDWQFNITLVIPPKATLDKRADQRLEQMLNMGALDEIVAFENDIREGRVPPTSPCLQALGYQALKAYLAGEKTKAEAVAQAQIETHQYAKRQSTWFRNQIRKQRNVINVETVE